MILILSENWTMFPGEEVDRMVHFAQEAEHAGFDGVMVSEHIVLGGSANEAGVPVNPRDLALPRNQEPTTPWPSSLAVLSAISSVTTRVRLVAGAVITPLRHPLSLAKEFATIDLLSKGRLVVLPTVSWHRQEFDALGVNFEKRGEILDEQLLAWSRLWQTPPANHHGKYFSFGDIYLEPRPKDYLGPVLWFGGSTLHSRLLSRLVSHGRGYNPLGTPTDEELTRLRRALVAAGREVDSLEMIGGVRGRFASATSTANLDEALAAISSQLERGFTTVCIKPSQFIDDPDKIGEFCREVIQKIDRFASS